MAHESDATGFVRGMFEVQLAVHDLAGATAFYRDRLGLEVSLEDVDRGRTHFRLGPGQLILAQVEGEPDASPAWPGLPPPLARAGDPRGPSPHAHGPIHFAIEVALSEVVAAGERLREQGLDVRGPLRWPSGHLSIYVHDPEGNVVELIGKGSAA